MKRAIYSMSLTKFWDRIGANETKQKIGIVNAVYDLMRKYDAGNAERVVCIIPSVHNPKPDYLVFFDHRTGAAIQFLPTDDDISVVAFMRDGDEKRTEEIWRKLEDMFDSAKKSQY